MKKLSTKAIHAGNEPNFDLSGDVVPPLHMATTYARRKVGVPTGGYVYSRSGNPTRHALEKNLAQLEGGKQAYAFATGLVAETNILLLLKKGDHVVVGDDVYGGTRRLMEQVFTRFGLSFTFVDIFGEVGPERMKKVIRKNTRMLWVESPTNPLLKVCDIAKLSKIAKRHKMLTVVDNTFATPYFQSPFKLGADIIVHSTTKYLNGHSDAMGGAVVLKDKKLIEELGFLQNATGGILSPFDSWLLMRGTKTLPMRMRQHASNAMAVAKFLEEHDKVKTVFYPGLASHPAHKIAKRQMSGFGGMVSFELKGTLSQAVKFMESLKLIVVAESLGTVISLIDHPASMTHAAVSPADRRKIGLTDGMIRFSVGTEEEEDIIKDLAQALGKI